MKLPEPIKVAYEPSEQLRKVQLLECEMLRELLAVCEKYKLHVWACAGTLLGAIRHRGFIPWDDDIDVLMFREDYDKLLEIGPKEFKEPYFFQSAYTDINYSFAHSQLRRSDTTAVFPDTLRQPYNQGIFIDIFVFDAIPEDDSVLAQQCRLMRLLQLCMYWRFFWYTAQKWYRRIGSYIFHLVASCFNHRKWYRRMEKYASSNNSKGYTRVASLMFDNRNIGRTIVSLSDFRETIWVPFENLNIPVPIGYDNVLKKLCGEDYMTPIHKSTMHGNKIIFDTEKPYTYYTQKQ